jgi:hypothetical protein
MNPWKQLAVLLTNTPEVQIDANLYPYRQIIGNLLYVAMYKHPAISYAA